MSLALRTAVSRPAFLPVLPELPRCASRLCPRPPSLWQRWWARHEGTWLEGSWYCSADCLYQGLLRRVDSLQAVRTRRTATPNHVPLGLVLLSRGAITGGQLRQALHLQRTTRSGKLGQWLVRMGAVTEQEVTAALAVQQGCPVFAPQRRTALPPALHWPLVLIDAYRAVPLLHSQPQSTLYVGFLEGVHHAFLCAVEHVLHCVTQPCIVPPPVFRRCRERQLAGDPAPGEAIVIQQHQNTSEMVETLVNYAEQVKARHCAVTLCEQRLWARLSAGEDHIDFLFRLAGSE